MTTAPSYARIDRRVIERTSGEEGGGGRSLSELARVDRFVLLGEPGSGKSTAFLQAADAAGAHVVTARDFAEGARPAGPVVFIDALEEYRIGEPPRGRLADLVGALKRSGYTRWRIACRAVSLPPSEIAYLERELGAFETWLLQPMGGAEIRAVLEHWGEPDPGAFMARVNAMAAGSLMSNPATLRLLRITMGATTEVSTRGALLEAATLLMAHEVSQDYPERDDRPPAGNILNAAQIASLVLLLSGRENIWNSAQPGLGDHLVTRDHLLEAKIDTLALKFALDTPLFVGAGGEFRPAHRIVAEFLAGRALAQATDPGDSRSALTVERALALLCGAGSRPAPALTGVFAWFVCALSGTRHADRALELALGDPESIIFHGDPAMLPTPHRKALLSAIGREDPWFLSSTWGATATGGLSGEDLADDLIAMILDATESDHRRILALEALANGRPIARLRPQLVAFAADPTVSEWFRRRAIEAALNGAPDPVAIRRQLLDGLAAEPEGGPILLRLHLLAGLVGFGVTASEVREAFGVYGAGDGTMGYSRALSEALSLYPLPDLFDAPLPTVIAPVSRSFEISGAAERILAATIAAFPETSATRLVGWIGHLGLQRFSNLKDVLRDAVAAWTDLDPARPQAMVDAIVQASGGDLWSAGHQYRCMTGREVPDAVRATVVERLEAAGAQPHPNEEALANLGELAARLTAPASQHPGLYGRARAVLEYRPGVHERTLTWLNAVENRPWEIEEARLAAEREDERDTRRQSERSWLAENAEAVRSGGHRNMLRYAAELSVGYHDGASVAEPEDRLAAWFGAQGAQDLRLGWAHFAAEFPTTVADQGELEGQNRTNQLENLAAVYVHERRAAGETVELSPPLAFAVLRGRYLLRNDADRDAVARLAADRILRDQEGQDALLLFWTRAIESGAASLPHLAEFQRTGGCLSAVLERLLANQPNLSEAVLGSALLAAVGVVTPDGLGELVAAALNGSLSFEARRLWSLVAFILDPLAQGEVFDRVLNDETGYTLLSQVLHTAVEAGLSRDAEQTLERDEIIARRLAAIVEPADDPRNCETLQQLAAGAIGRLADSPLVAAGVRLEALRADPALSAWSDLLSNKIAAQAKLRRNTEFMAPAPSQVARALAGGPPANPADLRAVLGEVLADLGKDIVTGPTAPWRGYWNRPHKGKPSPKIENECRDLLTDRFLDRLLPYRIKVTASTEHRSQNDRRVDLVVIGEQDAAVPIEAKRHYNKELWTAVGDQLLPYSETLRSSGHGIYLIFWFGDHDDVPTPPAGVGPITSAEALRTALVGQLAPALRDKIDVVVLDVSQQETITEKKERELEAREQARIAEGKKPRRKPKEAGKAPPKKAGL